MRLFTAIRFDDEAKDSIMRNIDTISSSMISGNLVPRDNLHLTLVPIGETNDTAPLKVIMDRIDIPSFDLYVGGLGVFKRTGGDVLWHAVDLCPELLDLHHQLQTGLSAIGYKVSNEDYKPTITLGRDMKMRPDFSKNVVGSKLEVIKMPVKKVSIMKNVYMDGKQLYSELYSVKLKDEEE